MTDILPERGAKRQRIDFIDILRAVALLAMASYHFTWDLDFHGFVARGTATTGFFRLYARGIASSFLFLVGISLVLAHARGIRWRSFAIREAQVIGGALAVTIATRFATPDSFVFFGILHQIALASLIGLLFLRASISVTLLAGVGMIALPFLLSTPLTEPRWLAWIGLAAREPVTNDYVPVLPWTGIVLLGIGAGRILDSVGAWRWMAAWNDRLRRFHPLAVLGRHSLIFYLLHQPILFGLVAAAAYFHPADQTMRFGESCRQQFREQLQEPTLGAFCDCVGTRLQESGLLAPLLAEQTTAEQNQSVRETSLQCSFDLRQGKPDGP